MSIQMCQQEAELIGKVMETECQVGVNQMRLFEEERQDEGRNPRQTGWWTKYPHNGGVGELFALPSTHHEEVPQMRDLWSSLGGSSVVGLAYVDSLCLSFSASVNENLFVGHEGKVAAHELGHSIGAFHDGQEGCDDRDVFIMAAFIITPDRIPDSLLENAYRFSPCSIAKFNTSLRSASCTHQDSSSTNIHNGPAGQLFNADEQCRVIYGSNSSFCRRETSQLENCFDSMCAALLCVNPTIPSQCSSVSPMPRTSCGSGKWCEAGRCVANTEAPTTVEGCPQGDDPTFACDAAECPNYSAVVKSVLCCNTCNEPYICPVPTTPTPDRKSKCSWRHRR
ncbi:metalloprotease mig-17-like [Haliotis asinina]|uniref:metalloprotease mig-17-like n=1 Tax=Haliotis asinina TaxID=109174 RepID=UPI003531DA90